MELFHTEDGVDPRNTDAANTEDRNNHRDKRRTHTAKRTRRNLHKTAEEVR